MLKTLQNQRRKRIPDGILNTVFWNTAHIPNTTIISNIHTASSRTR